MSRSKIFAIFCIVIFGGLIAVGFYTINDVQIEGTYKHMASSLGVNNETANRH